MSATARAAAGQHQHDAWPAVRVLGKLVTAQGRARCLWRGVGQGFGRRRYAQVARPCERAGDRQGGAQQQQRGKLQHVAFGADAATPGHVV